MKRSTRNGFTAALAAVMAMVSLTGCFQEGDEARFLPSITAPVPTRAETLVVDLPLEARVAPDNQQVVAGSFLLLGRYDTLKVSPIVEYQGSGSGLTKEVVAFGVKGAGQPMSATRFAGLPGVSCPGVPDSDRDGDPVNDNGLVPRFAGQILDVGPGTQEVVLTHGAAFPCWGISPSDLPNDVGVPKVRMLCIRRVPI